MNENERETTRLYGYYEEGRAYQMKSGLARKIPQFVRFYEGDQWAPPTKNTKNLPRPVVNIVKMICRNKKSSILSGPVRIEYGSEQKGEHLSRLNRFAAYIQDELGQEELDARAISDGVKKGSYFYHYYWDSEARGKDGVKCGALRCEIIDPLSIFFSNPTQRDEQKQKWILIASREDVDSVRAQCDRACDRERILPDEGEGGYGTVEPEGRLCTVFTCYFRREGLVYCEKATKYAVVNAPFPLTPDFEAAFSLLCGGADGAKGTAADKTVHAAKTGESAKASESAKAGESAKASESACAAPGEIPGASSGRPAAMDAPDNALPDSSRLSPRPVRAGMTLYPVVVGNYEEREHSIFGIGEVEGVIPNQKSINFNIAMSLLNAQENAWGKYVVLPGALSGQTISNEPGQVLTDYSGTGEGIRRLKESAPTLAAMEMVDTLTRLTRVVTGSTEVMTGETLGGSMSGAAIAQLQSMAEQPVKELRRAFFAAKEKQGRILSEFFRYYYVRKEFPDGHGGTELFRGDEYGDGELSVIVRAVAGTSSSAAGDITALDALLSRGLISPETYLAAYPPDALSNREKILEGLQRDRGRENQR